MRVLFCNYEYPPLGGGGGVINAMIARELAKRHEVTVLTSRGLDLPADSVESGVRIIRVPVHFRRLKSAASLLSMLTFLPAAISIGKPLLRANHFDVINTHFVMPTGPVGDTLARSQGIPNVLSLHGGDLYDPSKLTSPHRNPALRVWIRRLLRRADVVVGQSTNTLANMRRYYTPEIAGVRIPLGIERPPSGLAMRARYGCREEETLLVTVGRLVARKGIAQLIAMMEELGPQQARLLIIGDGPQEQLLKKETAKRQLEERICFLGFAEEAEKFRILRMCDIYVSTSQHEGFGLVFLEAMACGLPVVCYDHGGQTDFLRDGETGYLVPLNNLRLFTERCASLIGDGDARKMIGEGNAARVEEFFIERCALAYERTFASVIETRVAREEAGPLHPAMEHGE